MSNPSLFVLSVQVVLLGQCCIHLVQNLDPLEKEYGKIEKACIIFRHGDRSPLLSYPNDPHKNYPWPAGFGQVLNKGEQRLYALGKWFRERYDNLIPRINDSMLISIQSSDQIRAVVSAQCFLNGFFSSSPYSSRKFVSIEKIVPDSDNLLSLSKTKKCFGKRLLEKALQDEQQIHKIHDNNIEAIKIVEANSGWNFSNYSKYEILEKVSSLAGVLKVQTENGLPLPKWTDKVYPNPIKYIKLQLIKLIVKTENSKRLLVGPIFEDISRKMNEKVENSDSSAPVLQVYSGHDSIIDYIRISLGIFDDIRAPYGASLIFELRRNHSTEHTVTVSWKNETNKESHLMNVLECEINCKYHKFVGTIGKWISKHWYRDECAHSQSYTLRPTFYSWMLYVLLMCFQISSNLK